MHFQIKYENLVNLITRSRKNSYYFKTSKENVFHLDVFHFVVKKKQPFPLKNNLV